MFLSKDIECTNHKRKDLSIWISLKSNTFFQQKKTPLKEWKRMQKTRRR